MNKPNVGDRIKLTAPMIEEPCPVDPGSTGTVTYVNGPVDLGDGAFMQINVQWDNGRNFMMCSPPDRYVVIP